jgi:hypothetical protein
MNEAHKRCTVTYAGQQYVATAGSAIASRAAAVAETDH